MTNHRKHSAGQRATGTGYPQPRKAASTSSGRSTIIM